MRKSSVEDTFDDFFAQINWYTDLLNEVTEANGVLGDPAEKKEIFQAFVLRIQVTWDIFVEKLIVDCLNRDTSQYARHKGVRLPMHLTLPTCSCLLTGLGFFDVRRTSEITRIAKNILVPKHNPFQVLKDRRSDARRDVVRIDEFYVLRNYLAHYSEKSKQALMSVYKDDYGLKKFREPGEFLYAHDSQTKRIRFANYIDSFMNVADRMAAFFAVK